MPVLWLLDKALGFVSDFLQPILLAVVLAVGAHHFGLVDLTSLIPDPFGLLGHLVVAGVVV